MEDVWVPIVLFAAVTVVLSLWQYFRYRTKLALQHTVQAAIEKGQELSPEWLTRLGQPESTVHIDLRRGVVSVALAAAFAIVSVTIDEGSVARPILAVAAFPFMLGVAYLALWGFSRDKSP